MLDPDGAFGAWAPTPPPTLSLGGGWNLGSSLAWHSEIPLRGCPFDEGGRSHVTSSVFTEDNDNLGGSLCAAHQDLPVKMWSFLANGKLSYHLLPGNGERYNAHEQAPRVGRKLAGGDAFRRL